MELEKKNCRNFKTNFKLYYVIFVEDKVILIYDVDIKIYRVDNFLKCLEVTDNVSCIRY